MALVRRHISVHPGAIDGSYLGFLLLPSRETSPRGRKRRAIKVPFFRRHKANTATGPDDLSTTIRYQRDDPLHFLHYVGRFLLFIWLELPLYFLRKNKPSLALRACASELASYAFMYYMTFHIHARASTFVLLIPFVQLRLGLMIGNWGQHALVDEAEPDSDFR
ncbi:hypothetical protein LTS18_001844, partial [Coniosporium uncinatum]